MSSIQPAQHKSPLVPSLFKTIRSGYSLGMLSKDVSAGITVGVVALPLALAFAIASGLTPERGLYTSIIAGFFMAFSAGAGSPSAGRRARSSSAVTAACPGTATRGLS